MTLTRADSITPPMSPSKGSPFKKKRNPMELKKLDTKSFDVNKF